MTRLTKTVVHCPDTLSRQYLRYVERLGKALATAEWRPEPTKVMVKQWDKYIRDWSTDKRRPLFVRRRTVGRGSVIPHESGRQLIAVDNSTAHWVYRAVLENREPPKRLRIESIPVAMALTRDERKKATYDTIGSKVRLSNEGWKLCHMDGVKLGYGELKSFPIDELQAHFIRFLSPSNMFVAPLVQQGVGELDQVIQAIWDERASLSAAP